MFIVKKIYNTYNQLFENKGIIGFRSVPHELLQKNNIEKKYFRLLTKT